MDRLANKSCPSEAIMMHPSFLDQCQPNFVFAFLHCFLSWHCVDQCQENLLVFLHCFYPSVVTSAKKNTLASSCLSPTPFLSTISFHRSLSLIWILAHYWIFSTEIWRVTHSPGSENWKLWSPEISVFIQNIEPHPTTPIDLGLEEKLTPFCLQQILSSKWPPMHKVAKKESFDSFPLADEKSSCSIWERFSPTPTHPVARGQDKQKSW